MEKTFGPNISWRPCHAAVVEEIMDLLRARAPATLKDGAVASASCARLPFYRNHELLELRLNGVPNLDRLFLLFAGDDALWLDGTSTAMHDANAAEALALTDATVLDYVRFFLFFVRGDSGAFTLIESAEELAPKTVSVETLAARRAEIAPFRLREPGADGRLGVAATIAYGDALFAAVFAVTPNGNIEMVDDDPLATLDGLAVPTPPDLAPPPVDPKPKRKPPRSRRRRSRPASSGCSRPPPSPTRAAPMTGR